MELTRGAIQEMIGFDYGINEEYIVDVTKIIKSRQNYRTFTISDGLTSFKAVYEVKEKEKDIQRSFKQKKGEHLRIKILQHMNLTHNNDIKGIQILDYQLLKQKNNIPNIKTQEVLTKIEQPAKHQGIFFTTNTTKQHQKQLKQEKPIRITAEEYKKLYGTELNIKIDDDESETRQMEGGLQALDEQTIKNFEKISDLYQSFYGWQILVRVIDTNYRQFTSKVGRLTKILNLQMVDKCGSIIQGNFFGQLADYYQNIFLKGHVYRLAGGKIIQEKFPKQNSPHYSKYSIMLNSSSQITQVKDVKGIPYCSNNWLRISQISEQASPYQQCNYVALIVQIRAQKCIQKQNKTIMMQTITVGDPLTDKTMQCMIWNRNLTIDMKMLNKSVLLKSFKVNKYKNQMNLYSTFKSDIISHHFFQKYQGYTGFHQRAVQSKAITIRELGLRTQSNQFASQNNMASEVAGWVNQIGFHLKWHYEACPNPKCRKAAVSQSKCSHCQFQILQSSKKFILQVQVVDHTGSLWVTAFDEQANIVLNSYPIDQLVTLQVSQLKQLSHRFNFQQYRMLINSKRDKMGKIKHTLVGHPYKLKIEQWTRSNLSLIHELRREMKL